MAGVRSLYGAVIPQDTTAFDEAAPMSAWQTLLLRNNVQHLVDMSVQYRVHWCASTGSEPQTTSAWSPFYWVFPLTITDRNYYPSFDVRVATRLTGAVTDGTIVATLTKVGSNTPIFKEDFAVSLTASTWHSASVDVTYPWLGDNVQFTYDDPSVSGTKSSVTTGADFVMCMLTVTIVPGTGVGDIALDGVQLREYLSQ